MPLGACDLRSSSVPILAVAAIFILRDITRRGKKVMTLYRRHQSHHRQGRDPGRATAA